MASNIKPLCPLIGQTRLQIEERQHKSESSIAIPDAAPAEDRQREVIAAGAGEALKDGGERPFDVKT